MIPSAELNCCSPATGTATSSPFGIEDDAARSSRASAATSPPTAAVDRRAGRRRLPRASVLDRRDPGDARAAGHRLGHRGLQCRLRARARPRALDRPLGRAARCGQACMRSRPTTATTRASTPISPGPGSGRERRAGRRARRAPHGMLLQHVGATHHTSVVAGGGPSRCTAIRAARSRSSSASRVGAAVNAGRLGYRYGAEILATTPTGSSRPRGSTCPSAPYARVEVADARGGRAWTNPL